MFKSDRAWSIFLTRILGRELLPAIAGLVLCLLSSRNALAQATSTGQAHGVGNVPESLIERRPAVEQRFLHVEFSFWSPYGMRLSKNGQTVGPGFFSIVPDAAVGGSIEAKKHAFRARVSQGFTLGFALAAIGLIVAGVAVRADNGQEWTNTSRYLVGGGIPAILSEFICALIREREILEAVNSYNYDLVRGNLEK